MRWRAARTSARSGTGEAVMPRVYHGTPAGWSLSTPVEVVCPGPSAQARPTILSDRESRHYQPARRRCDACRMQMVGCRKTGSRADGVTPAGQLTQFEEPAQDGGQDLWTPGW